MNQSRWMSFVESLVTTLVSGGAAFLANYYILPLIWGLHPSLQGSLGMAVFFGCLSVAVKYPIRRIFNALR